MLDSVILSVILLIDFKLNVIILSIVLLRFVVLSVIMPCDVLLSAVILIVIVLGVIMSSAVVLSVEELGNWITVIKNGIIQILIFNALKYYASLNLNLVNLIKNFIYFNAPEN
jgi:hypothetical protein